MVRGRAFSCYYAYVRKGAAVRAAPIVYCHLKEKTVMENTSHMISLATAGGAAAGGTLSAAVAGAGSTKL